MKKNYLISIFMLLISFYSYGQWNTTDNTLNIKYWNNLGAADGDYGYYGMCLRYKNNQWESFHSTLSGMAMKFAPNGIEFITAPANTTANISTLLRISASGNIGIGTKTPQANIDITTGGAMLLPAISGTTNTSILRVGHNNYSWAGGQLDIGIYNNSASGYPAWIQVRNPTDYSINRNLLLNPNGGNVGIGTTETGTHKLAVEGTIGAREIIVEAYPGWSDFVFNETYDLKDLEEVENFIYENKHLPDIPSEKEVLENGIHVGEMNAKLLQKIEELTLYMIEMNKEVKTLKSENELLKNEINTLKTQ